MLNAGTLAPGPAYAALALALLNARVRHPVAWVVPAVLTIIVAKAIALATLVYLNLDSLFAPATTWLLTTFAGSLLACLLAFSLHAAAGVPRPRTWLRPIIPGVLLALALVNIPDLWSVASRTAEPTICIDEAHGRWEPTDVPFTTTEYGRASSYTYTLLRQWLEARAPVTVLRDGLSLTGCNLLLLKLPTSPYSMDEAEAVRGFVKAGGGLVVIADHTDLFGSTTVLNRLLGWAGLKIRLDAVIPVRGTEYRFTPAWWNRTALLLGVPFINFQTAASITMTAWNATPEIIATDVVAEGADYSNERFFGPLAVSSDDRLPPLVLAAAIRYGRGRVVVFGDSTIWSTFAFAFPYNRTLLRNLLRLAANAPRWGWVVWSAAALSFMGLVFRDGHRRVRVIRVLALAAAFAALLSGALTWWPTTENAEFERASLCFDTEHGRMSLFTDIRTGRASDLAVYSAFSAWTGRLGLLPAFSNRGCTRDHRMGMVIVNPAGPFSRRDVQDTERFVRAGGRLLVLDDPLWVGQSTASQILAPLGISPFVDQRSDSGFAPGGVELPDTVLGLPLLALRERLIPGPAITSLPRLTYSLDGVEPDILDRDGSVVLGHRNVGAGVVMVFLRSAVFSQYVFGDIWGGTDPGSKLALYELEYRLLRELRATP